MMQERVSETIDIFANNRDREDETTAISEPEKRLGVRSRLPAQLRNSPKTR
jgi:hypothetical protein